MSYKFTAYDKQTGQVRFSGTADVLGELETESTGIHIGDIFTGGWLQSGEHFHCGEPPSKNHTFDWQTKQWQDLRTLAEVKLLKNLQINESRLAANRTSFTFNNKQIAADALSRSDIDAMHGIVLLNSEMPAGWQGGWKAMDNTYVAIPDVATWSLFYTAMVSQGQSNFAHSQELKATLAAATTIEEVEAITWLI
jgi:hypothetical protein